MTTLHCPTVFLSIPRHPEAVAALADGVSRQGSHNRVRLTALQIASWSELLKPLQVQYEAASLTARHTDHHHFV
jgi:hypothetical protein